jgi:hypothetical protein
MVVDLARKYAEAKRSIDALEKELEPVKALRDQLADSLKTEMEREEMQKFQLMGVGTFFLSSRFFPKVVGDEAKAIEWLDAQGADVGIGVAPRTVNKTRLSEFIKDRLENDQPLPPTDLFESTTQMFVKMLKAK